MQVNDEIIIQAEDKPPWEKSTGLERYTGSFRVVKDKEMFICQSLGWTLISCPLALSLLRTRKLTSPNVLN